MHRRTCYQRHPLTDEVIRWEELEDYSQCGRPHYGEPRHFVRQAQSDRGGASVRYTPTEVIAIAGGCLLFGPQWWQLEYVWPDVRQSEAARLRHHYRGPRALLTA